MRGFPKHINTKTDASNLIDLYPEKLASFVEATKRANTIWVEATKEEVETNIGKSENFRIIEATKDQQVQYQKKIEDPNSAYLRLGLDKLEVSK